MNMLTSLYQHLSDQEIVNEQKLDGKDKYVSERNKCLEEMFEFFKANIQIPSLMKLFNHCHEIIFNFSHANPNNHQYRSESYNNELENLEDVVYFLNELNYYLIQLPLQEVISEGGDYYEKLKPYINDPFNTYGTERSKAHLALIGKMIMDDYVKYEYDATDRYKMLCTHSAILSLADFSNDIEFYQKNLNNLSNETE